MGNPRSNIHIISLLTGKKIFCKRKRLLKQVRHGIMPFSYLFVALVLLNLTVGAVVSTCNAEKISEFSVESTPDTVRLNFTVEGSFPKKINTKDLPKMTILFKELQIDDGIKKKLQMPPTIVEKVNFTEGSDGLLEITFADPKVQVEYLILPVVEKAKAGTYRLVIDAVPSLTFMQSRKAEGPYPETLLEEEAAKLQKEKQPALPYEAKKEEKAPVVEGEIPFEEIFFVEAEKAYDRGEYERALALYRRYIDRGKGQNTDKAYYGITLSLYKLHEDELSQFGTDIAEAAQMSLKQASNDPRAPLTRCILAKALFATGMTKRAQGMLEELSKQSPSGEAAVCVWKNLGEIYLQKPNYLEAIRAFFEALKFSPDPREAATISMLMGKTLSEGGAYKQALMQLRRAVELYPALYIEKPQFLKVMGESLFGLREYQGALKAFLWYLNLSPQAPSDDMLWVYIAETLMQTKRDTLAERIQNNVILNMPDTEGSYIAMLRMAQRLEEKGKADQALYVYEELASKTLPEGLAFIHKFKWASLLKNQKKFEEALTKVDEFMESATSRKETDTTLEDFAYLKKDIVTDWLLDEYHKGHYQKVIELYKKFRTEIREDGSTLEALAMSFYREKDCFRAAPFFDRLIVSAQNTPKEWLIGAAYCAYATGELEKAETLYRRIPNLDTEQAVIFGKILMIRKQCPEARKIFERVLASSSPEKETVFSILQCSVEMKDWAYTLNFISDVALQLKDLDQQERFSLLKLQIQCLESLKRTAEEIEKISEAIAVAPSQEEKCELIYKLYNIYLSSNRVAESESALKELAKCENPFWKRVGEEGLRYLEFTKKTEKIKRTSGASEKP